MTSTLELIRQKTPLVLSITNNVVINFTANILLAIGASPFMIQCKSELAEVLSVSQALLLNIGNLDANQIHLMHAALELSTEHAIVLDPVGAGASKLRKQTCLDLLESKKISVLKGNASEILALTTSFKGKGVDSQHSTDQALDAGCQLSEEFQCVIIITGQTDQIISGRNHREITNGAPIMTKVTGMGCIAGAVIAAFCAVEKNYFKAAAEAMHLLTTTGERIALQIAGPASFEMNFIDALYQQTFK